MIIDAHAHVVAPEALYAYKGNLLADGGYHDLQPSIPDDAIAAAAARNVALMDMVGTDLQLLSPRPFQQMHSMRPARMVHNWIRANNDVIARTVAMHPDRFAGVAGLPTTPDAPVEDCFEELDRAINDLGFVGVCLNPDPHEGTGKSPTMGDEYWYPLYERLVALDVPIHVHSAGCFDGRETYSEHFITEESIAILSVLRSTVFEDFPDLKIMISHAGGSVPYQVGRWQAERVHPGLGGGPDAERFEVALRRFWFDTVLHHPDALELLFKIVGPERCVFGTERPGSGSAPDPDTGRQFDDIKPLIEGMDLLDETDRHAVFEGNARTVFSRLRVRAAA
jgi:predicted TIM-barrel fold metal-dependent hydrolase